MSDVPDPVEVDKAIIDIRERLENAAGIINQRLKVYREAQRAYNVAFATAFAGHQGPQTEKRQMAILATQEEARLRDEAQAALQYARDRSSDLRNELRALQTVAANIREAYRTAGYGR